ncbi:hypothetical protein [Streptomyces sp. D54]|uniref:hypothetical protein n=1 Tax=Streptomyces sp. D54 TaxID=1290289 RepID=UPI003CED6E74
MRTERLGGGGNLVIGRGGLQEHQDGRRQGEFAEAGEGRGPEEELFNIQQSGRVGPAAQGGPGRKPVQRFGRVAVQGQVSGQADAGGGFQADADQEDQQQCASTTSISRAPFDPWRSLLSGVTPTYTGCGVRRVRRALRQEGMVVVRVDDWRDGITVGPKTG